jgi:NAD(P)-dependent dehydrogenase (short-subunit alcohol dehydrogenase family)
MTGRSGIRLNISLLAVPSAQTSIRGSMPTCFITGVTGQDGAYLAQIMLRKGYRVVGLLRRSSSADTVGERLRWLGILDSVELVDGNLLDLSSLIRAFTTYARTRSTIWVRRASLPHLGTSRC